MLLARLIKILIGTIQLRPDITRKTEFVTAKKKIKRESFVYEIKV
jgi:hypothetical protein